MTIPFTFSDYFSATDKLHVPRSDAMACIVHARETIKLALDLPDGAAISEGSVANIAHHHVLIVAVKLREKEREEKEASNESS